MGRRPADHAAAVAAERTRVTAAKRAAAARAVDLRVRQRRGGDERRKRDGCNISPKDAR
jgi:hypothetical protein